MVPQDYNFSRCGRTDKGVSAMNQVISLHVRSNLTREEQQDEENDGREIDYVHILNQLLPDDIRISAVCLRPPTNFDARFSCQYRHYRYLFHGSSSKKSSERYEVLPSGKLIKRPSLKTQSSKDSIGGNITTKLTKKLKLPSRNVEDEDVNQIIQARLKDLE